MYDAALWNFYTPECGTINLLTPSATPSTLEQLPAHFYLIRGRIQLDCFDRHVYSQCALCNKTWLKFRKAYCFYPYVMSNVMINNNCQDYDCSTESLLVRCNEPFHFCSRIHITFLLSTFK